MALCAAVQHDRWQPVQPGELSRGEREHPVSRRADSPTQPERPVRLRQRSVDDQSRHNIKMGVALEHNRKTEPVPPTTWGFNFGHDANNPLSTGNGYANMLLGVFTTYTELTSRVDRDVRHWQNDFYVQDNWRVTPRLTVDVGLRVQHSGSDFEVNNMNSGFFEDQWSRSNAARVPAGLHGRPSGQPGVPGEPAGEPSTLRIRTYFSRPHSTATSFRGLGVRSTESPRAEYRAGNRGPTSPSRISSTPRAGFAWNMFGDGKTALRGSWGIFYNFPRSTGDGGYPFSGGCPISCYRQLRWATFNDITSATASNLIENPVNVNIGGTSSRWRNLTT